MLCRRLGEMCLHFSGCASTGAGTPPEAPAPGSGVNEAATAQWAGGCVRVTRAPIDFRVGGRSTLYLRMAPPFVLIHEQFPLSPSMVAQNGTAGNVEFHVWIGHAFGGHGMIARLTVGQHGLPPQP